LGPHHRAQDGRRRYLAGVFMPHVTSIGTYLPCWGTSQTRVAGDDEDAITLAVEAARGVDVRWLLRGSAVNQVDDARIVLAHNIGGPTAVSAVTILEGPGTDGG
jgi:hypothetical protein